MPGGVLTVVLLVRLVHEADQEPAPEESKLKNSQAVGKAPAHRSHLIAVAELPLLLHPPDQSLPLRRRAVSTTAHCGAVLAQDPPSRGTGILEETVYQQ